MARAAKPLVFGAKHQTQNVVRQSRTNILPKIHRGAESRAPSSLVRPSIKMCAHGAHTFVFHAPEGRASYTAGVLHVPKARFVCGATRRTVPRETVFSAEKRLWKNVFEKKTKKACIPE